MICLECCDIYLIFTEYNGDIKLRRDKKAE
jgi:hypothetical protein